MKSVLDYAIKILKQEITHVYTYSSDYDSWDEYNADLKLNLIRAENMRKRWSFKLPEHIAYFASIDMNFERKDGKYSVLVKTTKTGYTADKVERLRQDYLNAEKHVAVEFELFKQWFDKHGWWLDGIE